MTEHNEEIPTIDKHEVLIKVKSVSLNYRDIAISSNRYPFPVKDNIIPCSDCCGEIVDIADDDNNDLSKGDIVVGNFDLKNLYGPQKNWDHGLGGAVDGVLREYLVLPLSAVTKVPQKSSLTPAQWASVVCTGTTAWNALYGNIPLRPGQTVLFLGTGGVSMTGLLIAKAAGAVTIITSSSDEKLAYVKEKYGVDYGVNYTRGDWSEEVLRITEGKGVDYILENGGSGTIKQSINAITMGGTIAIIGFLSAAKQEDMPDVAGLALSKGAIVRGITVGSKQLAEEAVRFFGVRNLGLPVEKEFGSSYEEVQKAFEYFTGGSHIGKVCINFD